VHVAGSPVPAVGAAHQMLSIGKMLLIGKMLSIRQILLIGRMLLILPAPAVGAAPHDISPPIDIQLILELKVGVLVAEGVQVFPYRRCHGLTFPVDKHLTDAPSQTGTHHMFWFWSHRTMMNIGQWRWGCWRVAHPLL
jgi:hypothetical protein